MSETNEKFMKVALEEAKTAASIGEIPIGCVLVKDGEIIAQSHNLKETNQSSILHAEINAIQTASKLLNTWRLIDVDCYVTLEPCHMCASALQQARIRKIYFAASDPKTGAIHSMDNFFERNSLNHYPEIESGLLKDEASQLLKDFFSKRRKENRKLDDELGGRSKRRNLKENN